MAQEPTANRACDAPVIGQLAQFWSKAVSCSYRLFQARNEVDFHLVPAGANKRSASEHSPLNGEADHPSNCLAISLRQRWAGGDRRLD